MQQYRIFSKTHPEGWTKPNLMMPKKVLEAIEADGVYRGGCQCCGLPIVIREIEKPSTAGDEHFLMHSKGGES